jgi:acyl-CoA synthetase (AMP-forming)/AMP-acid ligase II
MHEKGNPPKRTLGGLLLHAATSFGGKCFLATKNGELSFSEADRLSLSLAAELIARGVTKGTRVGVLAPNGHLSALSFLAAGRIGALVVPLSTLSRPQELMAILKKGDVSFLIASQGLPGRNSSELLREVLGEFSSVQARWILEPSLPYLRQVLLLPNDHKELGGLLEPSSIGGSSTQELLEIARSAQENVHPADWLAVIFTSGSSGAPKGVVHSHGTLVSHSGRLAGLFGVGPQERVLAGLPFFWIGGLTLELLASLHTGATLVTHETLEPGATLELCMRYSPTRASIWSRGALERIVTHEGFQELPEPSRTALERVYRFPVGHPRVANSLGMTETCGPHSAVPYEELISPLPPELEGSFGRPVEGIEHRIVDPASHEVLEEGKIGELLVRGPNLMQGLYKAEREETFDKEGWYHTGDLALIKDGNLFFKGRLDDLMKTSGANVSPIEVQQVLITFPGIRSAFVFASPATRNQSEQEICAVVVRDPEMEVDAEEVLTHARHHLAAYKVPAKLIVVSEEEVPYLASGKVDVSSLVVLLGADRDHDGP